VAVTTGLAVLSYIVMVYLIFFLTYTPITSLRLGGHYLAMVTISFQTILTLVLTNWVAFTRGPDGVPNIRRPVLLAESGP
jgi:ABC-type branched-subunit amino acid transport system permease subunit